MKIHVLEREQRVERPLEEVFEFYGDARNLEAITPAFLGFEVLTPEVVMRPGARIDYKLRLHGVPVKWRTRIEVWEPPRRFVDVQVSGPYALWHHTHSFEPAGEGATVLRDRVRYALPLGPLGELARLLLVERDVERIFDHRRDAVAAHFGS